jgi:tetratricopeptide (TPR) repeat protein
MPRPDKPVARWVDEGATTAPPTRRAAGPQPRTVARITVDDLDPRVQREVRGRHGAARAPRVLARLAQAAQHFEAHRYAQARTAVLAHLRELEGISLAHEILGLSSYRVGRWAEALRHLETARALRPGDPSVLVVIADCHRALGRHGEVERLWAQVREASPPPWILAEGRMTMAGSLADRGELAAAIRVMTHGTRDPRRVREHHLREWYVLADLYDRAGEVATARRLFAKILGEDPRFADAADRLAALGR